MKAEKLIDIGLESAEDELIARARDGKLLAYTTLTFPKYQINWHHKLTCKYLNKLITGEIKRLMIFEPPRYGKSELTSRRLPSLIHGLFPDDEILAASYNSELAADMTADVQRIMDTPMYHKIFPNTRITGEGSLSRYARSKNEHELIPVQGEDKLWLIPKGSYRSAGVGGSFTGRGGNWVLIDDPFKNRKDADSKAHREMVFKFYNSTLRTRLEKDARVLITMTRWHEDDLAGKLLKLAKSEPDADRWVVLRLPAVRDDVESDEDPRMLGEPLWPEKYDAKSLSATRASSGSREWSSLYQQTPVVEGGNIIKREWIKFYKVMPTRFDEMIQSWDFATKDKDSSDYAVGQVWGRIGIDKYLIYQMRGRWSFPISCKKLIEMSKLYPRTHRKIVEAKANGPAVVQTLNKQVPGLVDSEPYGDKVARLNAIAPDYESGNIWYPDESIAPWVNEHIDELVAFPHGEFDDSVDAASQAIDKLRKAMPMHLPIAGHGSGTIHS